MSENGPPADLHRQAAARAAAASSDAQAGPAAPGDVFVLHESSEQPVQWIVLARDPARPEVRLVVAADANPLVGSEDLEVGDEALGPLAIRRPFGGWLATDRLSPDLRVGALRLDRLGRAREHWFGEAGKASVLAREVDEDPEYLHWRGSVLGPAHRAVFEPESVPLPKPKLPWPAVAAAAALLMTVGGAWLHKQQVETVLRDKALTEERLQGEIRDLRGEQAKAEERHRSELDEGRRQVEDYEAKLARAAGDPGLRSILRDFRTQLQSAWSAAAILNPAIKTVRFAATRGRVEIKLPPEASHLVLELQLDDDAETGDRYRLDLLRSGSDELLWTLEGLESHSLSEITVGVPAKLVEAGRAYDLRLVREGASASEADLYMIHIQ